MTPQQAYDWIAPKLHTSERAALDLIMAHVVVPQSIESAPKDGSCIMVNDTTIEHEAGAWVSAKWIDAPEWSGWCYEDDLLNDNNPLGPLPTHWIRSLPAPGGALTQRDITEVTPIAGSAGSGKSVMSSLKLAELQQLMEWSRDQRPSAGGDIDLTAWPGWSRIEADTSSTSGLQAIPRPRG